MRRAVAGGAVGGAKGCSGTAADERGGAAAGKGGESDAARGLLQRVPQQGLQNQGADESRGGCRVAKFGAPSASAAAAAAAAAAST